MLSVASIEVVSVGIIQSESKISDIDIQSNFVHFDHVQLYVYIVLAADMYR